MAENAAAGADEIDLKLLRLLDALYATRSVTRAAERLALSQRLRDFAVSELKLPDNASYRRFADLKRGAAVWNVVAAPELSLQLKTWCYPVMGCAGYRGYFERGAADSYAAALREEHYEVSVYGVPAYSTLGRLPGDWMADPLLNTFIHYPEGELARLIFHELAHQVAYAADDTEFNESFATAVERIGGARWLASHASDKAREEYAVFDGRRQDFRAFTMGWREQLAALSTAVAAIHMPTPKDVDLGPLRLVVSYREDPTSDAAEGVATLIAEEAMRFASAVGPRLAQPSP